MMSIKLGIMGHGVNKGEGWLGEEKGRIKKILQGFLTLPKACETLPLSPYLFCCRVDIMPLYLRARKGIKTVSGGYFYLKDR